MDQSPETRLSELKARIAEVGFALPGTVNVAMNRCGKPNCACHADPPKLHGPYVTWTRKVEGKTVTRRLSAEQLERYEPWFENRRRLRELVSELEALSLEAAERAEGWASAEPRGGSGVAAERPQAWPRGA